MFTSLPGTCLLSEVLEDAALVLYNSKLEAYSIEAELYILKEFSVLLLFYKGFVDGSLN